MAMRPWALGAMELGARVMQAREKGLALGLHGVSAWALAGSVRAY